MLMPPYINDLVEKRFGEDFELFLIQQHNDSEDGLCDNYADFINGFTLAILYLNQDIIPETDHKWLRIKTSMVVGNVLYKLAT